MSAILQQLHSLLEQKGLTILLPVDLRWGHSTDWTLQQHCPVDNHSWIVHYVGFVNTRGHCQKDINALKLGQQQYYQSWWSEIIIDALLNLVDYLVQTGWSLVWLVPQCLLPHMNKCQYLLQMTKKSPVGVHLTWDECAHQTEMKIQRANCRPPSRHLVLAVSASNLHNGVASVPCDIREGYAHGWTWQSCYFAFDDLDISLSRVKVDIGRHCKRKCSIVMADYTRNRSSQFLPRTVKSKSLSATPASFDAMQVYLVVSSTPMLVSSNWWPCAETFNLWDSPVISRGMPLTSHEMDGVGWPDTWQYRLKEPLMMTLTSLGELFTSSMEGGTEIGKFEAFWHHECFGLLPLWEDQINFIYTSSIGHTLA